MPTELDTAIQRLLDALNMRVMRGYGGASRADLFATLDRPHLQPLPGEPCAVAHWKRARVAPDYHVEVDSSWYSIPFRLIRPEVGTRVGGAIAGDAQWHPQLVRLCRPYPGLW